MRKLNLSSLLVNFELKENIRCGLCSVESFLVFIFSLFTSFLDFPESGKSGFGVHGLDGEANTEPIETETATYICSASKLNFTSEIHWYYQNGVLGQEIRADEMEGKEQA